MAMEISAHMGEQDEPNSCPGVKSGKTKFNNYLRELQAERQVLSQGGTQYSHAERLINQEIERIQSGGKATTKEEKRLVDIIKEKPIRLTLKVLVPVKDHPKFNFVGKLLGPKGNSLKRLQEETLTKMAILGKGSMRDKAKEEELRGTGDVRYNHLHEDLHVEVTTYAPPAEAYARVAYALAEVRKFLVPDNNDEIRQEQMREIQLLSKGNSRNESASPSSSSSPNDPKTNTPCPNSSIGGSGEDAQSSHPALRGFNQNAAVLLSDSSFRQQNSPGEQTLPVFTSRASQYLNKNEGGSTCSILNRLEHLGPSLSSSNPKSNLISLLNKTRNHLSKDDLMTLQALQNRLSDITSSTVLQRYGIANNYPIVEFYDPAVGMKSTDYQLKVKQDNSLKLQLLQDSLRFQPYSRLLSKTKNS